METPDKLLIEIKKEFYSYRNGIVADALKKIYEPSTIIYGLRVPQFMEIAGKLPKDNNLALTLWNDTNVRESRILALFVLNPESVEFITAQQLFLSIKNREEADFLSFKVLGKLPFAEKLYKDLIPKIKNNDLLEYALVMFKKNIDRYIKK